MGTNWGWHDLVNQGLKLAEIVSDPAHGTQIDEQVGQCVDVCDGKAVTQLRPFSAHNYSLAKNWFSRQVWEIGYGCIWASP
jgi:hypothetical protein